MTTAVNQASAATPRAAVQPYRLQISVVYQDEMARQWASRAVEEAAAVVGGDSVSCSWWDMHKLTNRAIGAEAFSGGHAADIIIVAVRAADRLPVGFYIWLSSFLEQRFCRDGLLVALVDGTRSIGAALQHCLETLARKCTLDFLPVQVAA